MSVQVSNLLEKHFKYWLIIYTIETMKFIFKLLLKQKYFHKGSTMYQNKFAKINHRISLE